MRKTHAVSEQKEILIGAMILFAVSAILGGAVANVYYVLVMRILVGISMGFVNAAAMALIAEVYVDEDKRGTIMGIFNATMAGTGAVISLIGRCICSTFLERSF